VSNEIWHNYESGNTLYALIWEQSTDYIWDNTGSAFVTPWNNTNVDRYDIAMTDHGGHYYTADFPSAIEAGTYRIAVVKQAAVGPHATNDTAIAQGEFYWTGDDETSFASITEQPQLYFDDNRAEPASTDAMEQLSKQL